MTELEIMRRAKMYIDSLANGIDPTSGKPANDGDVINNVRVSRCLYYVSGILQKVIENGGEVQKEKKKKSEKSEFSLTHEQIISLEPSVSALSITKVAAIINACIDEENMKKLKVTTITRWLVSIGLLTETVDESGRVIKLPSDDGQMLGLSVRVFSDVDREGKYVVYSPAAQQFIFDNIEAIAYTTLEESNEKAKIKASKKQNLSSKTFENQGQPWLEKDDEMLKKMFCEGTSVKELCEFFQRTKGGINARLVRLGLIENRSDLK